MDFLTKVPRRRNVRAFISVFITYLMLVGQAAPLALAAAPAKSTAGVDVSPVSAARRAPAPVFATGPVITATKVDSFPDPNSNGKAEPGDTVTYTVTITNTGDAPATGVNFNDSVDTHTTLVPGSVNTQPIAIADVYNVIGNVEIKPTAANGLLTNDRDPDTGNSTGLTASGPSTTTQGGQITINGDGSFTYNPAPGFAGTDTVTYTITDTGGKTDTATATFSVGNGTATPGVNVIWFVNSAAGTNGDGRLTSPFNCLRGPGCFDSTTTGGAADDPGDTIFLYASATNYSGGLTLLNNQLLIGQGASGTLAADAGYTVPTDSDPLPTLNNNPTSPIITTTIAATNAINVGGVAGANSTLRGFTVGNTTASKIASPASPAAPAFGTLAVSEVILNGTGQALNLDNGTLNATFVSISSASSLGQGINLDQIAGSLTSTNGTAVTDPLTQCILVSGSTASMSFGNTTCSDATDGISLQNNSGANTRTFGTLTVSGTNTGSAFLHAAGGGNTTVNGAANFVSVGNPVDIQNAGAAAINFAGGATVTKTTIGGAGVNLVASSVTFESLGITTSNGPGLSAITSGTVTVTNGSKSISATGSAGQAAPAIIANAITLNSNFSSVTSTNSGNVANGTGVSLTSVAGTSNFGTGSITGASGASFLVNGGTASVTYNGSITQTTAARVIDVQNKTGGTMAFGGAITSNNGTGQGVFLNSNTGATFNFTAGLNLSTVTNDAFTATGGGTVSATQNNTSIVNTLTTTTGQALKVTSTTIGASGLTFRSINANGGTNNGVTLDTTGAGPFTITGNGTAASGGTIQNKNGADGSFTQGIGIYLNAVSGAVSLTRMDIEGCQNYGIRGFTVIGGFTLDNSTVGTTTKNGTLYLTDVDADTGAQGEGSIRFNDLTGTAVISNDTLDNGFARTVFIHNNDAGSTLNLSVTNSTLRQSLNNGNGGDPSGNSTDAMDLQATNSATVNLTVTNCQFTAYRQFAILTDARDTATMNIDVGTSNFSNSNTGNVNASSSLNFSGGSNTTTDILVVYNVHNNTFRHGSGGTTPNNGGAHVVSGTVSGGGKFDGKILSNTFGVTGVAFTGAGNAADALRLFASGNKAATTRVTGTTDTRYLVQGNTIQRYGEVGIQFNARQGNSTLDATVLGNIIREPGAAAQGAFAAIWVNSGALPGDTNIVNIGIGSATVAADKNTMQDSDPSNATDVFLDKNTCAGCASQLRLYQNGSAAAGGTTEAKARSVLVDDNNPTLDLLAGFTNASAITFVAGLPPQPSAPLSFDPNAGSASTLIASRETTKPASGVALRPVVIAPRSTASQQLLIAPRVATVRSNTASAATQGTAAAVKPASTVTPKPRRNPEVVVNGAGGNISVNIGTLNAGDSVTITFQVTVDNPYSGPSNISNQGTVTTTNAGTVLTDDTAVGGSADPTLTPINVTLIRVNDAKVSEPASASTPMLFTVTLSNPAPVGGLTVNYATANDVGGANPATGGAACGGTVDYETVSGTLGFLPGESVRTISVNVCADSSSPEPDETLLLNINTPLLGNIVDAQAVGTITQGNPAGALIISELRTRGPGADVLGDGNDFVELYNNSNSPLTVASSDATAGYGIFKMGTDCNATPILIGTVPNGTIIPARGHYLLVGSSYSLTTYATGDQTMTSDIEDDHNVAVFSTASLLALATTNRLDSVGFGTNAGGVCELLHEGAALPAVTGTSTEHSFFRKECDFAGGCAAAGNPKDTGDNSADFLFADTAGTNIAGVTPHLGAPGPENKTSPIRRDNAGIGLPLLDATQPSANSPNRGRDTTSDPINNSQFGTMTIRRRVTNSTGATVTKLRFRIIELTTGPNAPAGIADLRARTSTPTIFTGIQDSATCASTGTPATAPCQVTVQGTTLEQPPNQTSGGGYNSTMSVTLPGPGLDNKASLDVQFRLGIQQTGTFRFYIIIEALP
jgi:hypothetical protein